MSSRNFSDSIFKMGKKNYLSKDDLLKVIRKYHRSKDADEKDRLRDIVVESNIRLVINLANRYASKMNQSPDDMFQNGIIGVIIALDRFKPGKRLAFSTYATHWINNFIRRAVAAEKPINTYRYLSAGAGKPGLYFKLFKKAKGDKLKFIDLLRKNGISRKDQIHIENIVSINQDSSYLDLYSKTSNGEGEEGSNLIDSIEDKDAIAPDIEVIDIITKERLMNSINASLTEIEQKVIYGLYFTDKKRNAVALSKEIGKSKSSIAPIEARALRKLMKCIRGTDTKFSVSHKPSKKLNPKEYRKYSDEFKKVMESSNPDNYAIEDLPMHVYILGIKSQDDIIHKIEAPTMRAAINFLRLKTRYYTDIMVYSVDGEPLRYQNSAYFMHDFKKAQRSRVRAEVDKSRWYEDGNKNTNL